MADATLLRNLLAQAAVHDPPWRIADDDGEVYITGKRGPGWYDSVADNVSNRETADLIVAAINALPDLLEIAEAADALIRSESVRLGDEAQIRLSNAVGRLPK